MEVRGFRISSLQLVRTAFMPSRSTIARMQFKPRTESAFFDPGVFAC